MSLSALSVDITLADHSWFVKKRYNGNRYLWKMSDIFHGD